MKTRHRLAAGLVAVLALLASCAPTVLIGFLGGLGESDSGGSSGPPLVLDVVPTVVTNNRLCVRQFVMTVNLSDVEVEVRVNGSLGQRVTLTSTTQAIEVELEGGLNTVVFTAFAGSQFTTAELKVVVGSQESEALRIHALEARWDSILVRWNSGHSKVRVRWGMTRASETTGLPQKSGPFSDTVTSFTIPGLSSGTWYWIGITAQESRECIHSKLHATHTRIVPTRHKYTEAPSLPVTVVRPSPVPPLVLDFGGNTRPGVSADGVLDVLVLGRNSQNQLLESLFVGDGRGGFQARAAQVIRDGAVPIPIIGELVHADAFERDGDGQPDLVVADSRAIRLIANHGPFFRQMTGHTVAAGAQIEDMHSGDFNGDGGMDVAVTVWNGTSAELRVFFNVLMKGAVAGKEDYHLGRYSNWPTWTMDWQNPLVVPLLDSTTGKLEFTVVDADGDGCDDVVHAVKISGSWRIRTLRMLWWGGQPTLLTGAVIPTLPSSDRLPLDWYSCAFVDVNYDNFVDLVLDLPITATSVRKLSAFYNDGNGGFNKPSVTLLPDIGKIDYNRTGGLHTRVVDVDGDAHSDVVIRKRRLAPDLFGHFVEIWRGTRGSARLEFSSFLRTLTILSWRDSREEPSLRGIGLGDFNDDGRLDMTLVGEPTSRDQFRTQFALASSPRPLDIAGEPRFELSGRIPTSFPATPRDFRPSNAGNGNLLLGVNDKVRYLPAILDGDTHTGAFGPEDSKALAPQLNGRVSSASNANHPGDSLLPADDITDFFCVRASDGAVFWMIDRLTSYSAFEWPGSPFPGARVRRAHFSPDLWPDILVVGSNSANQPAALRWLNWDLRTEPKRQNQVWSANRLYSFSPSEAPDLNLVTDVDGDGFDDTILLQNPGQQRGRVDVFVTAQERSHPARRWRSVRHIEQLLGASRQFDKTYVSIAAARFDQVPGVEKLRPKSLVLGADDGTVDVLPASRGFSNYPLGHYTLGNAFSVPGAQTVVHVHPIDVDRDRVPDLVVVCPLLGVIRVYRNKTVPVGNGYSGTGEFVKVGPDISVDGIINSIWFTHLSQDRFPDLVVSVSDGGDHSLRLYQRFWK